MSFAEQLVNKINEFRTNPKGYAKKIGEYVKYFKGKTLRIPGSNAGIRTEEGAEAYIEAADFLAGKDGVEPLEPSKGLARICEDFMAEAQKVDPNELGNIDLEEIIAKYGEFSGSLNRAMDFGGEDPEQVLINLIVCDGDSERGNRESLLGTELKRIGVATAKHPTYRYCTLIISCTKFDNNVDSDDYGFINSGSSSYAEKPKPASKPARGGEGNTIKPRKVVLKQKPVEQTPPPQNDEEEDDVPPEGVVSESRSEKIITEKGKKKRIIKIVRTMVDGSKETETIKEPVEDDD